MLLRALIELADIQFAYLTLIRKLHEIAVLLIARAEAVLWKVKWIFNQTVLVAGVKVKICLTIHKFIQQVRPIIDLRLIRHVVPDERSLVDIVRHRPKAQARIRSYQRLAEHPLWRFSVESHEQALHADGEESRQGNVENCVKSDELGWGKEIGELLAK